MRNLKEDEYSPAGHHSEVMEINNEHKKRLKERGARFITNENSHFPFDKNMYVECFGIYFDEIGATASGVRDVGSSTYLYKVEIDGMSPGEFWDWMTKEGDESEEVIDNLRV